MNKIATPLVLAATGLIGAAQAHEGHGLPGAGHWHGTDVLGYVLIAVIAATLWYTRRK